jgi:hypothetical protein
MKTIIATTAMILALYTTHADAATCTAAPLTTYLSGGSNATCSVGGLTFSDVQYAETGSMPLPAADIVVTPDVAATSAGLTFSGDFGIATPGRNKDVLLNFDVTAGAIPINGATVTLVGSVGTGGSYSDTLDLFTAGTFPPSFVGGIEVTDSDPTAAVDFSDQSTLAVADDTILTGVEDLSQITKQFSTGAPEPGTIVILGGLGATLICIGWLRRRRAQPEMRAGCGGV